VTSDARQGQPKGPPGACGASFLDGAITRREWSHVAMNRGEVLWAAGGAAKTDAPSEGEVAGADVVQVVLSWRDLRSADGTSAASPRRGQDLTVLSVREVKLGLGLALGEQGDVMVPAEVLGAERVEVLRYEGDKVVAIVPPGAKVRLDGWEPSHNGEIEVARGHAVELLFGDFVARMARVRPAQRPAAVAPLQALQNESAGALLGSALFHAAAFAFVAFLAPSLGATEETGFDRDRIELMQRLLNASAQHEMDRQPEQPVQPDSAGGQKSADRATGSEGMAGKPTATSNTGRMAVRGNARPDHVTLSREEALSMASTFGAIGMLRSMIDPTAPTATWGHESNGADDVNVAGHLYGTTIGEAFGTGWGLTGIGEGGGGTGSIIGMDGFGTLDHGCLGCVGTGDPVGIGHSTGHLTRPHIVKHIDIRTPEVSGNGHLPPEVIQRVVRQNEGRFRFCFQNGLKANPNLNGRVAVKFVIDRHGQVAIATDGGSDLPDAAVRQCVISSFTALSFPENDSGMVTVTYPIVFSPE
jgi:hypothetical protein